MKIAIYQIDSDRDLNGVSFRRLDDLGRLQGNSEVDCSIYNKVYSGDVTCSDLEDVYDMFNFRKPENYQGRPLDIGDVIQVLDPAGCLELVGRIRLYNSPSAFEEISFTDEEQFKNEIRESWEVGRVVLIDDFRSKHVPCVDVGFYFCDDFGFKKIAFVPEKAFDQIKSSNIELTGMGIKKLDDVIQDCESLKSTNQQRGKAINQNIDL